MTIQGSSRDSRARARALLLLIGGLVVVSLAGCGQTGHGVALSQRARSSRPAIGTPGSPPVPGASGVPGVPGNKPGPTPSPAKPGSGGNGRCAGYPNPSCTGVPAGTRLTPLANNNVDRSAYRILMPGTVLQNVHIRGDLMINANNVTVRDSQIDGTVVDEYAGVHYSFKLIDSTIGPARGCISLHAVGDMRYTASGLLVRGHSSGFMVSGDNVTIRDSFVRNCSNGNDHAGGIQVWDVHNNKNLLIQHNTLEQRGISSHTAPLFLYDSNGGTIVNVSVIDNMLAGGTYSLELKRAAGRLIVHGNKFVNRSWDYAPMESSCPVIDWAGNTAVTVDGDYRVTSTVRPVACVS